MTFDIFLTTYVCKSIIRSLHAPLVADIVHSVQASYENLLPGLPYPELPVICIKGEYFSNI